MVHDGQEVVIVGGSYALHSHEKLAIAVSKAMRGHSLQETKKDGRFHVHTKTFLDGAVLKEVGLSFFVYCIILYLLTYLVLHGRLFILSVGKNYPCVCSLVFNHLVVYCDMIKTRLVSLVHTKTFLDGTGSSFFVSCIILYLLNYLILHGK